MLTKVLVPPDQLDASDEAVVAALAKAGAVTDKMQEQALRLISKERFFLWSMDAVRSFVGVDYLGFGRLASQQCRFASEHGNRKRTLDP